MTETKEEEPSLQEQNSTIPTGKTKATLYYWPRTNMGLGHVATVVEEVGENIKSPRKLYISPGSIPLLHTTTAEAEDTLNEAALQEIQRNLEKELQCYDSPTVIKIELPPTELAFATFTQNLANIPAITQSYNLLANNCAHLALHVLNTLYQTKQSHGQGWCLLPSTVAKTACALLDKDNPQKNNLQKLKRLSTATPTSSEATTGPVSSISKYSMVKTILDTLLNEITPLVNIATANKQKIYKKLSRQVFKENLNDNDFTSWETKQFDTHNTESIAYTILTTGRVSEEAKKNIEENTKNREITRKNTGEMVKILQSLAPWHQQKEAIITSLDELTNRLKSDPTPSEATLTDVLANFTAQVKNFSNLLQSEQQNSSAPNSRNFKTLSQLWHMFKTSIGKLFKICAQDPKLSKLHNFQAKVKKLQRYLQLPQKIKTAQRPTSSTPTPSS